MCMRACVRACVCVWCVCLCVMRMYVVKRVYVRSAVIARLDIVNESVYISLPLNILAFIK